MKCLDVHAKLADLLFATGPGTMVADSKANADNASLENAKIEGHLAVCEACSRQLAELRATVALLDSWDAPEPNPYFLTRWNARLDEEREVAPVGWPRSWFERIRARVVYGSQLGLRPVAAMALTAVVLIGGGAYLGVNTSDSSVPQPPAQAAVVHDLQTLDSNAQLLDQLETLSSQNND